MRHTRKLTNHFSSSYVKFYIKLIWIILVTQINLEMSTLFCVLLYDKLINHHRIYFKT